jgi:hypothetical protein
MADLMANAVRSWMQLAQAECRQSSSAGAGAAATPARLTTAALSAPVENQGVPDRTPPPPTAPWAGRGVGHLAAAPPGGRPRQGRGCDPADAPQPWLMARPRPAGRAAGDGLVARPLLPRWCLAKRLGPFATLGWCRVWVRVLYFAAQRMELVAGRGHRHRCWSSRRHASQAKHCRTHASTSTRDRCGSAVTCSSGAAAGSFGDQVVRLTLKLCQGVDHRWATCCARWPPPHGASLAARTGYAA